MKHLRRADLHVHSSASFDVPDLPSLRPRALFEKALGHPEASRRMDFFTLTDHDTMAGYEALVRELGEGDRRLVIPAVEHTLRDPDIGFSIHVNLYGLDPDGYADLQRNVRTLDELIETCERDGILYQYNHPTWWERRELRREQVDFRKLPEIAARFPVLELNAGRTAQQNLITRRMAEDLGKALTSSTDTHTGDVGRAHTLAAGETAEEFLGAAWRGESEMALHAITYSGLLDEAHALIDEILQQEAGVLAVRDAKKGGQGWFERIGAQVAASRLVRENDAVRASLRSVLRQVSKPVMKIIMGHERRLENILAASELAVYSVLPEPAPVAIPIAAPVRRAG